MKKTAIVALTALAFSAAPTYAQAVDPEEFALEEVVVTATKTDMKKKTVPASVEVITREDINARGAHTLKDIISTAAGVSMIRSTGRDAVSIRGFESWFSMILIDGKRISSEIDQSYELERIALANVERIEIVRGPVSSLYGTDAMGGVVNIITKRAAAPAFSASLGHGANSRGDRGGKDRYHFTYDSGLQGKTGVTLSGSRLENNASFKSNGTTYAPYGERENISTSVDYRLTEDETITLTAAYMSEDTQEYAYKETPAGNTRMRIHDQNKRYDYSLSYNKQETATNSVFLRAYLSEYYKKSDIYNAASGQFMNFGDSHRTLPGFEARLTRAAGDRHILTYGGEYRPEKFRGTAVKTGQKIFSVNHGGKVLTGSGIDLDYSALYIQDQWQVSPKLLAVSSLRYDDSNRFESNLSPKLGLTYEASGESRLKLNVAKGFRTPTPNQLYISSSVKRNDDFVTLIGNDQLRSEKSNSYELSLEQDWGKATGKLTYFVNKLDNMIEEDWLSSSQVTYQNIDKATLQGVEAELSYPLSATLAWTANYTNLDATDDQNNSRLTNRARHKLASRLAYDDHDSVRASLWCEFYGDFLYDAGAGASKNKSYSLWNLNLEKALTPNYTFSVGVENLLNKKDEDLSLQGAFVYSEIRLKF
ncbi:Colicin I receptor [Sporomusa termitida]|uniref:Colicin I receptor n=2 Tax=Sporomusa termitida TaxID=2377 RepID=A0A517DYJ4_9FIRM|nr:Colicin I receptor [Sporomusa termitida]